MKVTLVPIDSIRPYERNAKTHPPEQVAALAKEIAAVGWTQNIVVDHDGVIVVGHGRRLAALELGLEKVPVLRLPADIPPERVRAMRLFDNRIAETDNDAKALAAELAALAEMPQFDVGWTGYTVPELLDILPDDHNWVTAREAQKANDDERADEVPELTEQNPRGVKRGQVWKLGRHRLMCGDSTSQETVERLMAGEKADMVFTDPPYNTGMKAKDQTRGPTRLGHMFNDAFTDEQWEHLLRGMCASYDFLLKPDSVAYVCLDWRRNHELIPHLRRHFRLSNIVVWDKVVHGLGSDYKYTYELINVCKKGSPKLDTHQGDAEYQDVWHVQRKVGRDEEHATKKPIELVERALRHASMPGNVVADLFGGSGSTLIACEKTGRTCFMMELDEHYCSVIIERWEQFTGLKAELISAEADEPIACES